MNLWLKAFITGLLLFLIFVTSGDAQGCIHYPHIYSDKIIQFDYSKHFDETLQGGNCSCISWDIKVEGFRINITYLKYDVKDKLVDTVTFSACSRNYIQIYGLEGYTSKENELIFCNLLEQAMNANSSNVIIGFNLSTSDNITLTLHTDCHPNFPRRFELKYEVIEDPCRNNSCTESDACVAESNATAVWYTCGCPREELSIGTEDNSASGVNFTWPATAPGSMATLPCPATITGFASRICLHTSEGARWGRPNLLGCVSQQMLDISYKVDDLLTQEVVSKESLLNVTGDLVVATTRSLNGSTLYPGDLSVATDAVRSISVAVKNATDHNFALDEVAQGYGNAVASIVDPTTVPVWKTVDFETVENKMASILSSVEELSSNIAKKRLMSITKKKRSRNKYVLNNTIDVATKNVDFRISFHERVAICDDTVEYDIGVNGSNSITVTSSVFQAAVENSRDRYIQVYTGNFPSIPSLLSAAQEEQELVTTNSSDTSTVINSDILSLRVLNSPEDAYSNLQKPITIVLQLQNNSLLAGLIPTCAFMNMSAQNYEDRWSNKGCVVDEQRTNGTHVVCVCTHLTNFAVLMDIFDAQPTFDHDNTVILTYISYIGGALSIIGCLITIIVFEFFRLRKERIRIHEQLALAIILVQIIYLAGIDRIENRYVCMSMAIALHYFLNAMFCWMLIEGFHLYMMLVKVFKTRNNFKKYLAFAWGVPLIVVGISAGIFHNEYGNDTACWLSQKVLLIVFIPAVGLVILLNTVVLLVVLKIMMRSITAAARTSAEDRSTIKSSLKAAAILLPLLGLTWTFGFFAFSNKEALVFTYLFTFCNSLQGVFFFLFHCLLSTDVHNAFERRSLRKSRSLFTISSSNKKGYDADSSTNSKSSSNTLLTDTSSLPRKPSPVGVDRIHRDPHMFENMGYARNSHYHQNVNFIRSYSDGVPYWRYKNTHNENMAHDDTYILSKDFHRHDYFFEDNRDHNMSNLQYQQNVEQHVNTEADVNVTSDANLYSKPIKKRNSSSPRTGNGNHVHFNDQEVTTTVDDDVFVNESQINNSQAEISRPRPRSPIKRHSSEPKWTQDFLEELKAKAASIRRKNDSYSHL